MKPRRRLIVPLLAAALSLAYALSSLRVDAPRAPFNLALFSQIPVLHGGRIKSLDTVARTSLLMLSGKQTVSGEDALGKSAISFLADILFKPANADQLKVFEINDPDVLGLIGIEQRDERRFAFSSLASYVNEIEAQAARARRVPPDQRSRFQNAILGLQDRISLYQRLRGTFALGGDSSMTDALHVFDEQASSIILQHEKEGDISEDLVRQLQEVVTRFRSMAEMTEFLPVAPLSAPESDEDWTSVGDALLGRFQLGKLHPDLLAFGTMADSYAKGDATAFNSALSQYYDNIGARAPHARLMAHYETVFNNFAPFYKSMVVYCFALVLAVLYWLTHSPVLNTTAFAVLGSGFLIHTIGLTGRMLIQGRPPVTNLYSSAVFVGWGAVLLGIFLEKKFRNGVGSVVAAVTGFTTLIIAHHLALQGDTMEMMRAVLDSNFWLTTHVVCITIGYSSTFLSGLIGGIYLVRRLLDRNWSNETAASFEQMVYGIVRFSTLFSFVGTVLGGIWADQSWGRFWGWDPKENGALLVVLWNVLILHAGRGGRASGTSIMVMAVFGNIITAMSWFGVNMLGVGLHSYGFMDQAFAWLMLFAASQILIMLLGAFPPRRRSSASGIE